MIGKTISHYKITEKIGGGGMGVVYKAQDLKLDRFVALKFLPPHLTSSEEEKQRFIHEAKAASTLEHNNICNIHEIDETEDGQLFISMAYYEGETLNEKVKQKPLPLEETIDITIQIAQGLAKAHEKKIVHRDIKPANIMLTADGVVKILDFGLAKLATQTKLTKEGTTLGTVAYMSPEQARGDEVDHRTDIWSLGVILYEILTGQLPFKGDYDQAMVYSIMNEEPEPMTNIRSELPRELESLVQRAMQKDQEDRYKTFKELQDDLNSIKKNFEVNQVKDREKTLPSIAVLPFVNISADPENEYFSDGLAEELINALSKLEGLHIVARTSAFRFRGKELDIRDIGRQLGVNTLLEGSVRKSGKRLRITAQLINVVDGYHLWSERYDRQMEDVFAIQDEISLSIVNTLRVILLGKEKEKLLKRYSDNLEAFQLYLKGRYYLNKYTPDAPAKAIECYNQALEKDPKYALAYAGLGDVYGQLGYWGFAPPDQVMSKAIAAAKNAIELDDNLAEAHYVWCNLMSLYEWDWSTAEAEIKKAIEIKPNDPETHLRYSMLLLSLGRTKEGMTEVRQAHKLDPLSLVVNSVFALNFFVDRNYEQVIDQCKQALEIEINFPILHWILWRTYGLSGLYKEAIAECKSTFLLWDYKEVTQVIEEATNEQGYENSMSYAAEKMVEQSKKRYVSFYDIALLYIHAKEAEQAILSLEKAYANHDLRLHLLAVEPDWDSICNDQRFIQLLQKIGLK